MKNLEECQIFKGPYESVCGKLDGKGLRMPTSRENIGLIYDLFDIQGKRFLPSLKQIKQTSSLWESTGNFYLPKSNNEVNNGVLLFDDFKGYPVGSLPIIRLLESGDPSVRFVPHGFKTGEQNWRVLEKNPYILARYGEEGTGKLAKLCSILKGDLQNVRVYGEKGISSKKIFYSDFSFFGNSFIIGASKGLDKRIFNSGYSFGARLPKK